MGLVMGAVKLRAADQWFSKCIRERAAWHCERCGSYFPPGSGRAGLHCSHFYGRGSWATRFNPDNCFSICYGCHAFLGANPAIHRAFYVEKNGDGILKIITELKNDLSHGRRIKREEKAISAHYRKQYKKMLDMRADGFVGRIEFDAY